MQSFSDYFVYASTVDTNVDELLYIYWGSHVHNQLGTVYQDCSCICVDGSVRYYEGLDEQTEVGSCKVCKVRL